MCGRVKGRGNLKRLQYRRLIKELFCRFSNQVYPFFSFFHPMCIGVSNHSLKRTRIILLTEANEFFYSFFFTFFLVFSILLDVRVVPLKRIQVVEMNGPKM